MTVLFADMAGSTALGEQLDPEEVRALQASFFELVDDCVQRFGGVTEKFAGDAVLAVFGIPVVHEDDAERALRAALAIRDDFASFAKRQPGELGIRVGVNTGEVVTGREAAARGELMVSGDAVNVAARLQQQAAVGQVAVGARTYAATQRAVAFEALPAIVAKGKSEPVEAWAALRSIAEPAVRSSGFESPLVGRDEELAVLEALAARVERDATPQLVTLYGEAGVGKSRLLRELTDALPHAHVLKGRCLPYEGVTYAPLAEALKAHAGILDSDSADVALERLHATVAEALGEARGPAVADALAWLLGAAPAGSPLANLEPDAVRSELVEAWRAYLEALGDKALTILAIEDVHWAAVAVLDLVEALVDSLATSRVLVLCTARPEVLAARPTWSAGKQNATALALGGLTPEEALQLVSALLGGASVPPAARERILAGTGGNPFFVEEMLRMLIDEGALEHTDRGWSETDRLTALATPDSVHSVIAARLDLLDPEGREALRRCSVVGHFFWPRAVGVEEDVVASLGRRGLVSERSTSAVAGLREFEFKHALTRDVAYGTLPRGERRELHRRVAEWIESVVPAGNVEALELSAYHYAEAVAYGEDDAGVREKAYALALAAGQAAFQRAAFGAATASLERAVSLAPTPAARIEPELLLLQMDSLAARFERVVERLDALEPLADDPQARAEILSWRSRTYWVTGRWADAMTAAGEAVSVLSGLPESVQLARALARRSQLSMLKALPRAVEDAREAIEVARRVGDAFAEVNARINLFTALAGLGVAPDPDEVLEIVDRAAAAADYEDAYRALVNFVWSAPGCLSRARVESTLATVHAERPDLVRPKGLGLYLDVSLVDMMLVAGEWDEADRRLAALEDEPFYGPAYIVWLIAKAALALRRGGPQAAEALLTEVRSLARATKEPPRLPPMAALVVPALALAGKRGEARAVAEEVLDALDGRFASASSSVGILRGLALVGAYDLVRRFEDGMRRASGAEPAGFIATSLATAAALLALDEGRPEEAVAALTEPARVQRERGWLYGAACLELVVVDALEAAGDGEAAAALRTRTNAFLASIGCAYPY
ncbi:MAG: hypothetical protein QOH73_1769 [Gaiellaceae bacterium]|nr:hypothetical protein [Gaiellaceae bacterium]